MFKIDFMVEDKNLPKVLHALAAFQVLNLSTVPVVNAVAKAGKVEQAEPGSSMAAIVASKVSKLGSGATVTAAQIKTFIAEGGGGAHSSSYFMRYMLDNGTMKRTKVRGEYKVQ